MFMAAIMFLENSLNDANTGSRIMFEQVLTTG